MNFPNKSNLTNPRDKLLPTFHSCEVWWYKAQNVLFCSKTLPKTIYPKKLSAWIFLWKAAPQWFVLIRDSEPWLWAVINAIWHHKLNLWDRVNWSAIFQANNVSLSRWGSGLYTHPKLEFPFHQAQAHLVPSTLLPWRVGQVFLSKVGDDGPLSWQPDA